MIGKATIHIFSYKNLALALIIAIPILMVDQNINTIINNTNANTQQAIDPYKK